MSFSFFRSFQLGKLLRLNVSKSGVGVSIGPRGASVSIGPRGTNLNVSPLPGSGIRMRERLDKPSKRKATLPAVLPFVKKYVGRKFTGDLGRGYDELITVVDVTLEDGEPRIHVRFGESESSYAYTLQGFGGKFGQMQEVLA